MTKEELKQELYHYIATQCSAISINMEHRLVYHYDQMEKVGEFIYNLEEKRIEELEQENTELKKKIGIYQKGMYDEIEKRDRKLTKAKNILKYVLNSFVGDLPRNLGYFDEEELKAISETEQFLKEIEENDIEK